MLKRRFLGVIIIFAFLLPSAALAQTGSETAPVAKVYTAPKADIDKIKDEGLNRSQVMHTLSYLTDVIGGRLTNSPNMKRANEWTRDTMAKWGMWNAKLEAWGPFGRGWSLKSFRVEVVEPTMFPVIAFPKAWSPSTRGAITGEVILLEAKREEDLAKYKDQLRGKIVLVSDARKMEANFDGFGKRRSDDSLAKLAAEPDPAVSRAVEHAAQPQQPSPQQSERMRAFMLQLKILNMLVEEGVAAMVDNSPKGSGGTLFVSGAMAAQPIPANMAEFFGRNRLQSYQKGAESKMVPQMTMASEDYHRLARMIKLGIKPKMTVDIRAQYHDDDLMGYNTTAEIPGTDPQLKDEIVMLGGHLDSWHASGGATDNVADCILDAGQRGHLIDNLWLLKRKRDVRYQRIEFVERFGRVFPLAKAVHKTHIVEPRKRDKKFARYIFGQKLIDGRKSCMYSLIGVKIVEDPRVFAFEALDYEVGNLFAHKAITLIYNEGKEMATFALK